MEFIKIKQDGLNVEYTWNIDSGNLESKIDEKLIEINPKIPGFRQVQKNNSPSALKVFAQTVRRKYGNNEDFMRSVLDDVLFDLLVASIVKKEFPMVFGRPKISFGTYEHNYPLTATIVGELYPENIPSEAYLTENESLTKFVCTITDKEIDEAIATHCKNAVVYSKANSDHKCTENDIVTIDVTAKYQGQKHLVQKALRVTISDLLPDFRPKVIGSKISDTIEIETVLPDAKEYKYLAGKMVNYSVFIANIEKKIEIKPTDTDLADKFGVKDIEDLRSQITIQLEREVEQICEGIMIADLNTILKQKLAFDVPKSIIEANVTRRIITKMQTAENSKEIESQDSAKPAKVTKKKKAESILDESTTSDIVHDSLPDTNEEQAVAKVHQQQKTPETFESIMSKHALSEEEKQEVISEIRLDFFVSQLAQKIDFRPFEESLYRSRYKNMPKEEFENLMTQVKNSMAMSSLIKTMPNIGEKTCSLDEMRNKIAQIK
jgi:FKBP-type peptidyl-prolyl cis-trans isomerase (trigger factor)